MGVEIKNSGIAVKDKEEINFEDYNGNLNRYLDDIIFLAKQQKEKK